MVSVLIPDWVRIYYFISLLIMIPDWLFIQLRPRSMDGGDLAVFFTPMNFYAKVDSLFKKHNDMTVHYIYLIGGFDLILIAFLAFLFPSFSTNPYFAVVAIVREAAVATKTLIYLLYSIRFILPRWRIPVTMLNGQWVIFPAIVIRSIATHVANALRI